MTEDDPDLDDLLSPDSEGGDDAPLTPMRVAKETSSMDQPQGLILNKVYSLGEATIDDLAEAVELDTDSTKTAVNELLLQGYLGTRYREDEEFVYVQESWGTQEFPSGPVIPLVYQYNLLCDSSRLSGLRTAVDAVVDEGDVVADLGAGVGALSHFAAERAEQVYAVEIDTDVYEKGKQLAEEHGRDNITYLCEDARTVTFDTDIDVVLCEMVDTALMAELQVPVMNHATENLLAEDGDVIPLEAKTTMQLVRSDYEFQDISFRLPHFEEYGSRESESISAEVPYHTVSFDTHVDEVVNERVELTATDSGAVNGIQLNTYIRFADGMEWTKPSKWFNAPLTLPSDQTFEVAAGDELVVDVLYKLGKGLNNIEYTIAPQRD